MKLNQALGVTTLLVMGALGAAGTAQAQVAGSTTEITSVTESTRIAEGWSVRKTILGKTIYNEAGETVGKVRDLIVAPDKNVSFVIVGAGGFIGIGRHDVAFPITSVQNKDGKLVIAGVTKASVKAMPTFDYAGDPLQRQRIITSAEQDIATAKTRLADWQTRTAAATAEAKVKLEQQGETLKKDLKATEDKLAEMKLAGAARWREFERDLKASAAQLRKSMTS
jgi:sporulation protein YlmC with PRC-barrel domain